MTKTDITTMRAQLARMVNYHEVALDRRASASTPAEIRAADKAVRDTAGMLDVSVIEMAGAIAAQDADWSAALRRSMAGALGRSRSAAKARGSRANGRRGGRPRLPRDAQGNIIRE